MSFAIDLGGLRWEDGTDLIVADLDRILNKVINVAAHLTLRQDNATWLVVNHADDTVMIHGSYSLCVRFMRAFEFRHPEATVDVPDEFSLRVPPLADVIPIREVRA